MNETRGVKEEWNMEREEVKKESGPFYSLDLFFKSLCVSAILPTQAF
jgi:hypothetical protein